MADVIPFPDDLMPEEQPAELSQIELLEAHMVYARRRWEDASERMQQYRVRQVIWAKFEAAKPHPDDPTRRKIGGVQPNSGPKHRKEIGKAIVEAFENRTKEVIDAIAAPLDPESGSSAMERHRAGMNIAKHARDEKREAREADAFARLTDAEVRDSAAKEFVDMLTSGQVTIESLQSLVLAAAGNEQVIDAEVVQQQLPS